jgi:hypothetical protein
MWLGDAPCSPLALVAERAQHHSQLWMRDLLPEVSRHAQRSSLLAGKQRRRTRSLQVPPLRECQRVAFRHRSRGGVDLVVSFFGGFEITTMSELRKLTHYCAPKPNDKMQTTPESKP